MFQIDQERWKVIYEEFRVIELIETQARFCVLFERQAIDQYIYALDVESMLIRKCWIVKKSQDNSYQNQVADFINQISQPDSYIFLFNHHRQNLEETIEILTRTQQQDNKILITISNIQKTSAHPDILFTQIDDKILVLSLGHITEPNIQIFIQNEFLDALQKYESAILKLYKIELLVQTISQIDIDSISLSIIIYNISLIKSKDPITILNQYKKIFQGFKQRCPKVTLEMVVQNFMQFKHEKNLHFPIKDNNGSKCRVCAQQAQPQVKKSIFKCLACKCIYKIKVTLCSGKCFKQFHQNPVLFLSRKRQLKS
ncbi:hypothetical protein pb186bvf_007518 [Paramecium bursaria]